MEVKGRKEFAAYILALYKKIIFQDSYTPI
jgi:hypothetical protein